jgi:hypothetical protein
MDDSSTVTTSRDKPWLFRPGNTEYAAKRRRIADRLAQLIADHDASPSQKQLLAVVANHLDDAERARSLVARVRAGNAARRLLKDIPRRPSLAPRSAEDDPATQALALLKLLKQSPDEV